MAGTEIYKKIKRGISGNEGGITLLLVDSVNYQKANLSLLHYLSNEKNMPGVYVTFNKPYKTLKKILEENGINPNKMIFIDGISEVTGTKEQNTAECLYIGGPEKLTDVSIAMDHAVETLSGKDKYAFLDSLSTLQVYHESGTVSKFAHFLTTKMREWGIVGVIISMEKETNETLLGQLVQFCDNVITIGGKNV
ncbi:MAG: ATPase domain-containing protein [archaeon]